MQVRCLVDVPGERLPSDLQSYLRETVAPEVPETLRASFLASVEEGAIRSMQNKQLTSQPLHQPGAWGSGGAGGGVGGRSAALVPEWAGPSVQPHACVAAAAGWMLHMNRAASAPAELTGWKAGRLVGASAPVRGRARPAHCKRRTPFTRAASSPSSPCAGALLLGDAFNMRHPLTGGGMTVALSDTRLLCEMLQPLPSFEDSIATAQRTAEFYTARKPLSATINTLANALYKVWVVHLAGAAVGLGGHRAVLQGLGGFGVRAALQQPALQRPAGPCTSQPPLPCSPHPLAALHRCSVSQATARMRRCARPALTISHWEVSTHQALSACSPASIPAPASWSCTSLWWLSTAWGA